MVDLAGSERVKLSTMSGKRLREAQTINKSLGSLGDVISSLASGHKHVPYRSSKLTFLLQDALKESSKVLMFININPSPVHTGESTNALQFGSHCRNVELGHAKRAVTYQVTKGEY
ncbi:KIN14R [Symbiodinium microadriaticum]|nr:KIN14R [Symbiodinium microadriaticum]